MVFKAIEFFAGVGLAKLGLEDSWEIIMANDNSKEKAETYIQNFGSENFILDDITNIDSDKIPSATLAWASFPCQDLSLAGYRQGMSGVRSGTFWSFWNLMKKKKLLGEMPPIFAIENVEGLLSDNNFNGLCHALASLELQFGFLVMDASPFIPQSRKRVFIVAIDSRIDVSSFVYEEQPTEDMWISKGVVKAYSSLDPELKKLWRWWKVRPYTQGRESLENLVESEPEDVTFDSVEKTNNLIASMNETNLRKLDFAKKQEKVIVGTLYKRTRNGMPAAEVRFDGIAGCLRTPKGGSSVQTIIIVNGDSVKTRPISKVEAARLMGVPDTYKLPEKRTKALYAMGDAVAVPVVKWLSDNLLVPLAEELEIQKENLLEYNHDSKELTHYHDSVATTSFKKWEEGTKNDGNRRCQANVTSRNERMV